VAFSSFNSRRNLLWIGALVALALLSLFAMWRSIERAMRMEVQTTVAASAPQLKVGDQAKVVLQLTAVASGKNLEGNALEKETETEYRRTNSTLKIAFGAATPIVMGKNSDLHPGAIVHVTARMMDDRMLQAEQIVILTGYITVQ